MYADGAAAVSRTLVASEHLIVGGAASVVALVLAAPAAARADVLVGVPPEVLLRTFSFDPWIAGPLLFSAALYARGAVLLGRRRPERRWRLVSFAAGLSVVALALLSPVDALGGASFAAHMAQHLLLVLAAAPLLILGRPRILLHGLPASARRAVSRARRLPWLHAVERTVTRPLPALGLHVAAIWAWHLPSWYEAALASDWVHAAEHASFLGTGLLFWSVLARAGAASGLGHGAAVLYVFAAATQSAVLGALITMSRIAWYPSHEAGAAAFGLTLLEDQQLAGLVMWVPASVVYLGAALVHFALWLRTAEQAVRRREAGIPGGSRPSAADPTPNRKEHRCEPEVA